MAKSNAPRNMGFTGTIGGSLSERKRKTALTGDQRGQLRGSSVALTPTPTRGLKDCKQPKRKRDDRSILVTLPDGRKVRMSSSLVPIRIKRDLTKNEPAKRAAFAVGAEYAETWANKNLNANERKQAKTYQFRGIDFDTSEAMHEYIMQLG